MIGVARASFHSDGGTCGPSVLIDEPDPVALRGHRKKTHRLGEAGHHPADRGRDRLPHGIHVLLGEPCPRPQHLRFLADHADFRAAIIESDGFDDGCPGVDAEGNHRGDAVCGSPGVPSPVRHRVEGLGCLMIDASAVNQLGRAFHKPGDDLADCERGRHPSRETRTLVLSSGKTDLTDHLFKSRTNRNLATGQMPLNHPGNRCRQASGCSLETGRRWLQKRVRELRRALRQQAFWIIHPAR